MRSLDTLPWPLTFVLRHLMIGVPLAAFIALFFATAFNDDYTRNFVYSLCIGLTCQLVIDVGRRLAARALTRWGRGGEAARRSGWPGWPVTAAIIVLGVWLGLNVGYALAGWLMGTSIATPGLHDARTLFIIVTISLLASVGFTVVSWGRGRLAASDARAQRAQRAAAENQLRLLESQLEPHMLFNTLANLRVLIALDPPRAQAMLDRLIAFLRATLGASRVGAHALSAEFERLGDYLALMQVRMGARLQFGFDLPDALRDALVPPLLLQPLVENSIQHGLEPKVGGGRIDLAAARDGDLLVLTVHDSGVGMQQAPPSHGTRFGTQQVRDRLAALYGARAAFTLEPDPRGGTLARIVLPLENRR
jgi:signal transduction histidine kinase